MTGSEKQIKWATEIVLAKNADELKNQISKFAADEDGNLDDAVTECMTRIDETMATNDSGYWIDNRDYKLSVIVIKKFTHTNLFKPAPANLLSEDAKWLLECAI